MQSRLFFLLLKPSQLSMFFTMFAMLFIVAVMNWPYFTYNSTLYPLLYGDSGVITALEQSPNFWQGLEEIIGQNPFLYGFVILVVATIVGWSIFLIIRSIKNSVSTVETLSDEGQRLNTIHHLIARIIVLTAWIIYGSLSLSVIFPFGLLISRIGAEIITTTEGILLNLGAFLLLLAAIHLHVIFLRMLLLRPRVFGGRIIIEDTTFYQH